MKSSHTTSQDLALLFTRLVLGAVFIWTGYAKWMFWDAMPQMMSPTLVLLMKFLTFAEPLGALGLIFGCLSRWAATCLAIIMTGSLYFVYFVYHMNIFTSQTGTGVDYNVLILMGCVMLAAFGPGRWSLDALRKKA